MAVSTTAAILTDRLSKVYAGGVGLRAVDKVSLTVRAGELAVVMGASGSGKSTLLNLIGGLDVPTEGRVAVGGVELARLSQDGLADFRREKVGFIFQLFNLIPELTALENVMMPLLPYRRGLGFDLKSRARDLLGAVGMGQRDGHFPGQLSGGEQQRVAIARALINEPPVILADEPTGNLDTRASEEVVDLLNRVCREQERTVLLVTHNPQVAAHADKVFFLRDGSLIGDSWTSEMGDLDIALNRLAVT